jgi:hypothetical protein
MFKKRIALVGLLATIFGVPPALAQNQTPASPPPVMHPLGFFVTSKTPTSSGNLGGLVGADKICQDLAATAGAGKRTWRAYLSTQPTQASLGVNARDRIGKGPWYNAKNILIAANVDDLHGDIRRDSNNIQKRTALTESGDTIKSVGDTPVSPSDIEHDILTGSDSHGRAFPAGLDTTCNNWTSDTDDHKAMVGHSDRGGGGISWNSVHMSRGCSAEKLDGSGGAGLLYCFAVD